MILASGAPSRAPRHALVFAHRPAGGADTSDFRILGVVRMTDGLPELVVELLALDDHFLRVDSLDGGKRDGEVARVLDVDHQLGPAVRGDLADGPEGLVV